MLQNLFKVGKNWMVVILTSPNIMMVIPSLLEIITILSFI